jgi:putative SOS response-associated peptidase YedK
MCGRYALTSPPDAVRALFEYAEQPNFPPRYNIAPTQPVPVVHTVDGQRRFTLMRWGFVPSWVKDLKGFPLIINIRSETAREKASFRAAFMRRRALMPADGFYEWQRLGKTSRPFLLRQPDRTVFAFAALWETWCTADGSELDTVALLNTHANGVISAIHERSPVILPKKHFETWLDPETEPDHAYALLQPPDDSLLEMLAIGTGINRVANDGPEVQSELTASPPAPDASHDVPKRRASREKAARDTGQGSLF